MQAINNELQITLSRDEFLVIHQSLNEVCNGLYIQEFDKRIGEIDEAKKDLNRLEYIYNEHEKNDSNDPIIFTIIKKEIIRYRNAVRETCVEIDDWEFPTRVVGLPKSFANQIVEDLNGIIDN